MRGEERRAEGRDPARHLTRAMMGREEGRDTLKGRGVEWRMKRERSVGNTER